MQIRATIAAIFMLFPIGANAEVLLGGKDLKWLTAAQRKVVTLDVEDNMSNGCWTNVSATQTAIALEFTRSNYTILAMEESPTADSVGGVFVYFSAFGYGLKSGACIGVIEMKVNVLDTTSLNSNDLEATALIERTIYEAPILLLTGPKSEFSGRIKVAMVEQIQQYLVMLPKKVVEVSSAVVDKASESEKAQWRNLFGID